MKNQAQTFKQSKAAVLPRILAELDAAKASGDQAEIWWALDDMAFCALHAPERAERVRAGRELEKHRAEYRTPGCTDRFGFLAVIWGLPEAPRPKLHA